ncbi:MAG: hypothetical protein AYK22_02480 [Thermoplasmatales archaeon SG8-52-3]|nr:MAG: hypothetical protein AYK22_02480 [Thermoplasmatales archaeon SG8-52-3]
MKKYSVLKSKNFKKIIKIITIWIFALIIVSGSSISIAPRLEIKNKNDSFKELKHEISNGPAPKCQQANEEKSNSLKKPLNDRDCGYMYGFNAYPGPESIVKFPLYDPGCVWVVCELMSVFISGGTYGCDGVWYACEYGNGILYGIDPFTCDMWVIGGGGVGLNALAYDPTTYKMYGSSDSNYLYEIDTDTGEQEQIGPFGSGVLYMIGMAFDADGVLYGWDLGNDALWTIDTESGEATQVGPLGISINYAQDGDFCRETDTLYLTAYTSTGQLYECDEDTGTCTLVGTIGSGIELTGSIIINNCTPCEHDVSIDSIDYPESGNAIPEMPMQVTVKNKGNNSETTDVQMKVIKYEDEQVIYSEDFSGTFPPDGWKTDHWTQNFSNNSGGQSPEAQVYKYDQYYGGYDYYDNYIQTGPIDCTGFEKIKVRFRWAADYYYPQYCSVYVKFRKNSTSMWKDITTWDNPFFENQEAKIWDINCYSFDELFDDESQIKFEYIGYYYYYNYLWLDDFEILAYTSYEDYNETVEDIEIEKGEEIIVEFPTWTPPNWQDPEYENIWEEYKIKACTLLNDDKPKNDCKIEILNLYYPWFHDIELTSIDSPCQDGPGKTYPVKARIKNIGQNTECCIPIDVRIGNPFVINTLFTEYDWPGSTYYPGQSSGWTDEHDFIDYYYGWQRYNNSYAGGEPYEVMLPYYYARPKYYFYSIAFNTSNNQILKLQFLSYINHYSGQGLYSLEAGYSFDTETWYTAWHEEPGSSGRYEVDVPIEAGSETTYIGFWIRGNPSYFNYWYIDDVKLLEFNIIEEYSESQYIEADISPGEEIIIEFEDWTPAHLAEMISGSEDYIVEATIEMEGDKNPSNDIKREEFTLDYWWDAGVHEITSPTGGHGNRLDLDELYYDNGDPDGVNGLFFGYYKGYENWLIDDFTIESKTHITGVKFNFVWNPGYSYNMESVNVIIVEDTDDCDPDTGPYYYQTQTTEFEEYPTGHWYFSRPDVICEASFEPVTLMPGHYFIGLMPEGIIDAYAYWLTATQKDCVNFWYSQYNGYDKWTPGTSLGYYNDLSWKIYKSGGAPGIKAWIQPGNKNIKSVVMNYGTFPYEDLTSYAQLWEFITDPENGTEIWTSEVGNINLTPLGGSKALDFGSYTFANEGRYGLYTQIPAEPDDELKNNEFKWGIGVDDTKPYCDFPPILDPAEPTGENGWYVDDVIVTLNATDPWSNDVRSGVKEIRYTIKGGTEQIIEGNTGSFVITEDGEDILVEYWAVDYVGNVEATKNSFTIDMDQTEPEISLDYEITGGNKIIGWKFTFIANAVDNTSGIGFVEFYFNGLLQDTVSGSGPEYRWIIKLPNGMNTIIKAIAYNRAGLFDCDEIKDPVSSSNNQIISSQKISSIIYQQFNNI